jgi:MFS family permease
VLFAVNAAGLARNNFSIENVAISLGVFIVSCVIMGQLGNWVGPRRRLWLITTNVFSTALIFAAAALQYVYLVEKTGTVAFAVIGLLAFGAGAQVAMARPLNVPQITTVSPQRHYRIIPY